MSKPSHPPYKKMVVEAIAALKDRQGSSRQAIVKHITATYEAIANQSKTSSRVTRAVKTLQEEGKVGNGKGGSFKFTLTDAGKAKPAKKPVAKKPAKKVAKKPAAKKPKKPAAKKPAAKKPAAKKPAAKPKKAGTPKKKPAKKPSKAKSPAKKPKKPTPKKAGKKPAAKKAAKK